MPQWSPYNYTFTTQAQSYGLIMHEQKSGQDKAAFHNGVMQGTGTGLALASPIDETIAAGWALSKIPGGSQLIGAASKLLGRAVDGIKSLLKGGEEIKKTVYTATDGPVYLNRLPSGPEGSSTSHGGTFVTEVDITNPSNLKDHVRQNIPQVDRLGKDYYPNTVSKIEVPASSLKPDPSVTNPTPGTHWIPPSKNSAKVTQQHKVVGETYDSASDEILPIHRKK